MHFRHDPKGVLKLISYFRVMFMILKLSITNVVHEANNDFEKSKQSPGTHFVAEKHV